VVGIGRVPEVTPRRIHTSDDARPNAARIGERAVVFAVDGQTRHLPTAVFERSRLADGHIINGPAIIQQMDATTVIPPSATARVDQHANLIIKVD
jgi:N-methylhydantoinase A